MVGGVSAKLGINLTVHFIWNKSTEKLLYQFGQTWSCKLHFATTTQPQPAKTHIFRYHFYILVCDADVLGDVRELPRELRNIARVAKNLRDFPI